MGSFKALDEYLKKNVENGPAGCGCRVEKDGEVLYENYFGYADLEKKIPVTEKSVYRQFSTTKVVVCTAAMMLFERGKFLLDDPISTYFPEWKDTMVSEKLEDGSFRVRPAVRPIQVRDCFTMSMGIGYGADDYTHQMAKKVRDNLQICAGGSIDGPCRYTLRDDIRAMSKVPVAFDPGTHWLYGFGHELVAGLIEAVSGKTVGAFLREELFEPLGMDSTGYRYFGDIRERMVTAYELKEDGSRVPADSSLDARHEPEAKYEGGGVGLFSTVRDYSVFMQMLSCGGMYRGKHIIGRKTIDLMRRNQLNEQQLKEFTGPYLAGYGYGLGVRTMMNPLGSNSSVGEFGWTGLLGTYAEADPSERLSIVYMHNSIPNREEEIHHRVRNIVYGAIE